MANSIAESITNVDQVVSELQQIIDGIVEEYTSGLTNLMIEIDDNVIQVEDPSIEIVRKYFMKLSSCMFFVAPRVETLSLFDAVSKIKMKEQYDNSFIMNDVKGADGKAPTATKLSTLAESDAKYESLVNEMYNKAYKIIRSKVDAAQTMVNSLSKLFSFKMSELSNPQAQNNRLLNEDI